MAPRFVVVGCVLALVSCGGSLRAKDAGGDGQIEFDGSIDAITDDVGIDAIADGIDAGSDTILCGFTATCTGTDICVTSATCGGPMPECIDRPDGGQCPAGTHYDNRCPGLSGGCRPDCFQIYACVPRPSECGANLDCDCAGATCNGMGRCVAASDRMITCGSQ